MVFLTVEPSIKMPSPCNSTWQEQPHESISHKQLEDTILTTLPTIVLYTIFTIESVLVIYNMYFKIRMNGTIVWFPFDPKGCENTDDISSTVQHLSTVLKE